MAWPPGDCNAKVWDTSKGHWLTILHAVSYESESLNILVSELPREMGMCSVSDLHLPLRMYCEVAYINCKI